jgi:hypothetical protein
MVRSVDLPCGSGPGRYPASNTEITLTAAMSQFFGAPGGSDVTIGGTTRRVVGLVENPAQIDDAFGLVTTAAVGQRVRYTLLVKASSSQMAAFRSTVTVPGSVTVDTPTYHSHDLGLLVASALATMLVAVLALTAFLVLAQRRVRQLGMLATIGATRRQVRNVTVLHGLIVGGSRCCTRHCCWGRRLGAHQFSARADLRPPSELEFGAIVADRHARCNGRGHLSASGLVASPDDGAGSGRPCAVEPATGRDTQPASRRSRSPCMHGRRALPQVRSPTQRRARDRRLGRDDRFRSAHHAARDPRRDRTQRPTADSRTSRVT